VVTIPFVNIEVSGRILVLVALFLAAVAMSFMLARLRR
jgi:hypothetical protein